MTALGLYGAGRASARAVTLLYILLLVLDTGAGLHLAVHGLLRLTMLGHCALWLRHQTGASSATASLLCQDIPEGCRQQAAYTLANP